MLDIELQKEIDIEIEKANPAIKSFLQDRYFRDTIDLVVKVSQLTPEQAESIELETILYVLGESDYVLLGEAIKNECGIKNQNTLDQVCKDLNDFILAKLNKITPDDPNSDLQKLEIRREQDKTPAEQDSKILRDNILENIGLDLKNNPKTDQIEKELKNIPNIKADDHLHDVYRELPDEQDNIIKTEIDLNTKN
jgi:hypothetical protein